MTQRKPAWEKVLAEATRRVELTISAIAETEDRTNSLGRGASGDVTLLADKRAEEELLDELAKAGKVRVLSEEAGVAGDSGAAVLAVVDPLDGSSNFERGIPFYCTSVAIADGPSLEEVRFGAVRNLVTGEFYLAEKGGGATKDGKGIHTSRTTEPGGAVVGLDLSKAGKGLVVGLGAVIGGIGRQVHYGANALELCMLAEGKIDAFVDLRGRMRITDFAAAYLIAKEAGAVFSGTDGESLDPRFDLVERVSFIASASSRLQARLLALASDRREQRA